MPTPNGQRQVGLCARSITWLGVGSWWLEVGELGIWGLGVWELRLGSSRLPGRSSGAGPADVILPGSCGSCGPCRAARSRRRRPPYGACSSGVERWTVAPEVAGSKPVTHPSFFLQVGQCVNASAEAIASIRRGCLQKKRTRGAEDCRAPRLSITLSAEQPVSAGRVNVLISRIEVTDVEW